MTGFLHTNVISKPDKTNHFSLTNRPRRNRKSSAIRELVKETKLYKSDFIVPFFLIEGEKKVDKISSMPGVFRYSIDEIIREAKKLHQKGILAIAIFPVIPHEKKCLHGKEALNPKGLLPKAITRIKKEIPTLCVISDVALDPYTSHGHDGVPNDKQEICNDDTLKILGEMALIQADAGIDIVAPSDMMDGRVAYIRKKLDENNSTDISIMSYTAKYASCFYAPFRDALNSKLTFGDKKTYQMDPSNRREALLEAQLDDLEGADMFMIKPASMYLDIISDIKKATKKPIAAYHVSGEYSMILAAEEKKYIDGTQAIYEILLSIKRAGADMIFTYGASRIIDHLHP